MVSNISVPILCRCLPGHTKKARIQPLPSPALPSMNPTGSPISATVNIKSASWAGSSIVLWRIEASVQTSLCGSVLNQAVNVGVCSSTKGVIS